MLATQEKTTGDFATEELAWEAFDAILANQKAFRVCREVCGEYMQPRIGTEDKTARIDRLLIPQQGAVDLGWTYGVIGVEGKKSGSKLGRVVSQALDYSRCLFELEQPRGIVVAVGFVFIFPAQFPPADLGSVMAQNRIGTVDLRGNMLAFTCGGTNGLTIDKTGWVTAKPLPMGSKRGSR